MKNKIIAGSILAGLGIIAQVLNQWLKHIFITLFYIAKGTMLQGGGSFTTPKIYTNLLSINSSIPTRITIWLIIIFGIALIITELINKK